MLPSLSDFGIDVPVYIRKIDSRSRWNPEDCNTLEERAKAVAGALFREPKNIYSIWLVNTDQEFYSVIASLSEYRSPRNQNIDFIWITQDELSLLELSPINYPEGGCLHARSCHFNIYIDSSNAETLCSYLIQQGREANRCSRNLHTKIILAHQEEIGCKATNRNLENCECEEW